MAGAVIKASRGLEKGKTIPRNFSQLVVCQPWLKSCVSPPSCGANVVKRGEPYHGQCVYSLHQLQPMTHADTLSARSDQRPGLGQGVAAVDTGNGGGLNGSCVVAQGRVAVQRATMATTSYAVAGLPGS